MSKPKKKKLKIFGWSPKSPKGDLWINWIDTNKKRVATELNYKFGGWKEDSYTIVRVLVTEI